MYHLIPNAYNLFVKNTHRNPIIKKLIFSLYYTCLSIQSAHHEDPVKVSDRKENLVYWTSLISTMVSRNEPKKALNLFNMMLVSEKNPNFVTVLSVINAVGLLNCEVLLQGIHGVVIRRGFENEIAVTTALIGVYSDFHMNNVWKLFDEMPSKDVVLWSAMISACVRNMDNVKAFEVFKNMQFHAIEPNYVSVVSVLVACADLGELSFGEQVHGFLSKRMFHSDTSVQNSLLNMYAKCRSLDNMIRVFNSNSSKDLITWKTMIHGFIENRYPEQAINIFSKMRVSSFVPTETIVHDISGVFLHFEKVKAGSSFHSYVLKGGYFAYISIGTSLLQMYAGFGEIGLAEILFHELPQKDFIAWSAMITVYAHNGRPRDALHTFKRMVLTNEKPNELTFVSLVQACSSLGAEEHGESIHSHAIKIGYLSNTILTSTLIDLYCKFGKIELGKLLFDETQPKDLICWSSMINGYGINGCGHQAHETFSNMLSSGIKPNDIVFISVLSACSHCGLQQEGLNWFYAMEEKYGIIPQLAHYACIVDLLSRHGNIEEALALVHKMPVEPDNRIWGALLAGCRLRPGTIKIAEFVANRLIGLDPENTSYYVILSNLYVDEGMWADAERMRNFVDEKGLKKVKGRSTVQAN